MKTRPFATASRTGQLSALVCALFAVTSANAGSLVFDPFVLGDARVPGVIELPDRSSVNVNLLRGAVVDGNGNFVRLAGFTAIYDVASGNLELLQGIAPSAVLKTRFPAYLTGISTATRDLIAPTAEFRLGAQHADAPHVMTYVGVVIPGRQVNDADDDGVLDGADNCPLIGNGAQLDFDGDGSGDACDPDDDNDGLSDAEEAQLGTNPLNKDSDGDGLTDKEEIDQGTDPNDASSGPQPIPALPGPLLAALIGALLVSARKARVKSYRVPAH